MSAIQVFIVDDNPANLNMLSGILRGAGYTVRMANSPERALSIVETIAPELIMLDVTMPKMDGYELCRELKAKAATAAIPVIFISALSEPLDKVKAFKSGGVDYVTKPFDADEVLARVETHLRLERLRREMDAKNRELSQLNELKNRFIGIAAHDLRSPLTAVIGYSELLRQHAMDNQDCEMLDRVLRSARFMLRLVNDLLDISAIEAGSVRLDMTPTDLVELVRTNVDLNATLAAPKQIAVRMDHNQNELQILVDEVKIEQVLNNLISNAVKFSLPGTCVNVRLQENDHLVRISVEDQGPGIPAEELERIFEPFQTSSVKSTAGEKSTGLGLAIAKKIVTAHGGQIWVESRPGSGATFHFTLPLDAVKKPE